MSVDDASRLVFAIRCRTEYAFLADDVYWLPLPTWLYATALFEHWRTSPYVFTLPSLLCLWGVIAVLYRSQSVHKHAVLTVAAVPMFFDFSTSVMSEPVYLLGTAMGFTALLSLWAKWSWKECFVYSTGMIAAVLSRYEAWISFGFLTFALSLRLLCFHSGLPRRSAILAVAAICLAYATGPACWMAINHYVRGSMFAFTRIASDAALHLTVAERLHLAYYSLFRVQTAECIAVATVACAALLNRHRHLWFPSVLLPLSVGVPYLMMLASNSVGSAAPERFALGFWIAILIAFHAIQLGLSDLAEPGRRSRYWVYLALLALLAGAICNPVQSSRRSGAYNPQFLETIGRIGSSLRPDESVLIFDYASQQGNAELQVFRCLLGDNRVIPSEWLRPEMPLKCPRLAERKIRYLVYQKPPDSSAVECSIRGAKTAFNGWVFEEAVRDRSTPR